MERDPHQLIEGVLIACYAIGAAQAFLYIRGEMALAQERVAAGAQRGLRRRLHRQEHPRHRLLRRHRPALGRRRLHRRRGDRRSSRSSRATGACRGSSRRTSRRPRASTCQPTIVNNVETLSNLPWIVAQRRRRLRRRSGADDSPGTRMFAVSGHVERPGVLRDRVRHHDVPRPDLRRRVRRGIRDGNAAQGVHPRWRARRRGSSRSTSTCRSRGPGRRRCRLDARLGRHHRDGRDHRHGARPPGGSCGSSPTSRAASARRAARARPGSRRSCTASSTATAGPSDLDLLLDVCDNISPGDHLAAQADHDLPARPVGRVADRVGDRRASATSSTRYIAAAERRRSPCPSSGKA